MLMMETEAIRRVLSLLPCLFSWSVCWSGHYEWKTHTAAHIDFSCPSLFFSLLFHSLSSSLVMMLCLSLCQAVSLSRISFCKPLHFAHSHTFSHTHTCTYTHIHSLSLTLEGFFSSSTHKHHFSGIPCREALSRDYKRL